MNKYLIGKGNYGPGNDKSHYFCLYLQYELHPWKRCDENPDFVFVSSQKSFCCQVSDFVMVDFHVDLPYSYLQHHSQHIVFWQHLLPLSNPEQISFWERNQMLFLSRLHLIPKLYNQSQPQLKPRKEKKTYQNWCREVLNSKAARFFFMASKPLVNMNPKIC